MEPISFELSSGTLNQNFNRIKNCRVVQPPYETQGYYSNKFFLDKRLGLEPFYTSAGKKFYDMINIKGNDYYLYQESGKSYIGTFNGASFVNVTPTGFTINSDSPIRLVYGKGIYGPSSGERTVGTPTVGIGEEAWTLIPSYAGGYVKFTYGGTQDIAVGDFIVFKEGALAGGVNRVELVSGGNIYIIGTNARGTVPTTGTKFDVYKANSTEYGTTLLVGHTTGVDLVVLNGYSTANVIRVLTTSSEPIIDMVNFDGNIFALTKTHMYFSRSTFDDNTQFYPLDYYFIDGGYKMFAMGKALLVFGRQNKLFSAANSTSSNVGYVGYDVNYNGDLYSKYSMIFTDQTIYILQSDKQLKQVDIVQNNTTTFDLKVTDVLMSTKGLFNGLSGGEVYITSSQRFLNLLYVKDGATVNYQYDKMYQHFIEQYYAKTIYNISDKILSDGKIYIESGYDDDGTEYEQEINFMIDTKFSIYKPVILRTMFGLTNNQFKVGLNIVAELGGALDSETKILSGFDFDARLSETLTQEEINNIGPNSRIEYSLTGDELIGGDMYRLEQSKYNGTIVSIQSNILRAGRFIKFKYNSLDRFMIGDSYIISDVSKSYINEPLLTN